MTSIAKHGLVLGVLVVAWTFVMGFTGWYKSAALAWLFVPVAALVQFVVLVTALRKTAAEKGYAAQVASGTLISMVASVLVFFGSILFTTVAFPGYFEEVRAVGEEIMRSRGMAEDEIRTALAAQAKVQTPFFQALLGAIGTIVTGLVVSLVVAIFARVKKPA